MLEKLATKQGLMLSASATVVLTIIIQVVAYNYQVPLLDMLVERQDVITSLNGMTNSQKAIHIGITTSLDVVYPLAFTAFFIGSVKYCVPLQYKRFALPLLLIVPIDWIEGIVQVMLLTSNMDVIAIKTLLTPVKFLLIIFGAMFSVYAWLRWFYRGWLVRKIKETIDKP